MNFVAHFPGIKTALKELLELDRTAKCRNALSYIGSFICIVRPAIRYQVLVRIDLPYKVIQDRDAKSGVELANIFSLLDQFLKNCTEWKAVWNESKLVATNLVINNKEGLISFHTDRFFI